MTDYIDPDYDADPDDIKDAIVEYVQGVFPGFDPEASHLWDVTTEALSARIAELEELLRDQPKNIFKYFGELVGITPLEPAQAVGSSTWTMINATGYTIPVDTVIEIPLGGDAFVAFTTVEDVVVPAGQITTAVGGVSIRAILEGADANNLTGPAEVSDINILDFVESVNVEGFTAQGQDAEDVEEYLGRLATRLRLLADRPILPEDFALYAAGLGLATIERVLALDLYDPNTDTWDNERTVCIVGLDDTGADSDPGDMAAAVTALEAAREVNFQVFSDTATRTDVTLAVTVQALPNYDIADLKDRVIGALGEFGDPNLWGQPLTGEDRLWINQPKVRYLEVASMIDRVEGVDFITSLTIEGVAGDFDLAGAAPLPTFVIDPADIVVTLP